MKTNKASNLPEKIGSKLLASVAGVTERRLYQLADAGEIPKPEKGELPLLESLTSLFRYLRRDPEKLRAEKLALLTAKREREQLRLAREAGVLVEIAALQTLTDAVVIHWREVIQAAPITEQVKASILRECQDVDLGALLKEEGGEPETDDTHSIAR